MPNILKQRDSLGEVVRVLTEIEKPYLGQHCIVRWTNCGNQYDAKAIIASINEKSVRVVLDENVPYPPHYDKADTPAYRLNQSITVKRWPAATHNNGVFTEVKS